MGRFINNGYVVICDKALTRVNRVLEHRYIMEQHLGRKLTKEEVVHHKNGIKTDNRLENLELMSRAKHDCEDGVKTKWVILKCPWCKEFFIKSYRYYEKTKYKLLFCGCSCNMYYQHSNKIIKNKNKIFMIFFARSYGRRSTGKKKLNKKDIPKKYREKILKLEVY